MKEIRALTGIRGIAALTVFLDHTHDDLASRGVHLPVSTLMHRLLLSGGRQVDIFFLLSGFILTLIYTGWFESGVVLPTYLKFLRRRFARIYPLHFCMVMLVLVFVLVARVARLHVLNGVDRFTLIFPLFLWVAAGPRRQHPWLVMLAIMCCGFAVNVFIRWGLAGSEAISRGLVEFALGSALAGVGGSRLAGWLRSNNGCTASMLALLVCYALTPDTGFVIAVCAAPLLLSLCGSNWLASFMGWTPVYFLGEISYSIYLGHFLFGSVSFRLLNFPWMQSSAVRACVGVLMIVAVVIGLSVLTYYTIERRGRDWLSDKRKQPVPQALAA